MLNLWCPNFLIWDNLKKKIKRYQREVQPLPKFPNFSRTMDSLIGLKTDLMYENYGKKVEENLTLVQRQESAPN